MAGESVALVSDAGTPLMSDPGAALVAAAARAGVAVSAVPGCCAAIAGLTMSALPTDRFCFEGFLPAKPAARRRRLEELRHEPRTLVFYEAPHRIAETLTDMAALLGDARPAAIARELTKKFETVYRDTLAGLAGRAARDEHLARGEIVIVIEGATSDRNIHGRRRGRPAAGDPARGTARVTGRKAGGADQRTAPQGALRAGGRSAGARQSA